MYSNKFWIIVSRKMSKILAHGEIVPRTFIRDFGALYKIRHFDTWRGLHVKQSR